MQSDLVLLHLSKKIICELSMTLCLVYKTKSSEQSSDTDPDAIKKNSPLVPYAGILLISVQRCERAVQSECSFTPLVLKTDSSMNTNLYTLSSVNKIAAVIVISICFWRDTTLGFSMIKCQPLVTERQWAGPMLMWRSGGRCLCERLGLSDVTLSHRI